jgi:HSP90 family molecular chaperone
MIFHREVFFLEVYIYIFCGLKVVVSTKSPKSDKQYVWEGEVNASSYTISKETDPEKLIPRGTRLTLHLKVCRKFPF